MLSSFGTRPPLLHSRACTWKLQYRGGGGPPGKAVAESHCPGPGCRPHPSGPMTPKGLCEQTLSPLTPPNSSDGLGRWSPAFCLVEPGQWVNSAPTDHYHWELGAGEGSLRSLGFCSVSHLLFSWHHFYSWFWNGRGTNGVKRVGEKGEGGGRDRK